MDEVEAGGTSYIITRNQKIVGRIISRELSENLEVDPNLDKYLTRFFGDYDQTMRKLAKR